MTIHNSDGSIDPISLNASQLLLRGSSLRNTEYIYGFVVYTGHKSRIMMNSSGSRNKKSRIEMKTGYYIVTVFLSLIAFSLFASLYNIIWDSMN